MSHIKPRLKPVYAHFRRVIHTAKTSAAKACENGAGNGSKTERKKGRKTGVKKEWRPGRETGLQDGRKRGEKGNGKRTGNGCEKRRGTEAKRSKKRARQNGGAFRKMLCRETLSGVFGRGKRIFPTDGKRKRVRIAPKPCRDVRSEYRVRRNGIKSRRSPFHRIKTAHKAKPTARETKSNGETAKMREYGGRGRKTAGKPTCERLPASAEKKARARVYIIMVINPCKAVGTGADEACICEIKAMNGGSEAVRRRNAEQRRACRKILP